MKNIYLLFMLVSLSFSAISQEFLVASGSSSGTYKVFLKEIATVCADSPIRFREVESHGAIENLDKLVNNEVQGAFMHSDVIFFRGQADNLERYKTLLALFNEDVHFVALSTSKRLSGGTLGFGAKPVVIKDISDLRGFKVGAAGGGYVTAQVINLQSGIGYDFVQFADGKEVMLALNNGEIDCAVFVGASPLPNLKDLGSDYKLLPVPSQVSDRLKSVYKPSTVTYTKMSPNGVSTIAAQCLFVSRDYKTKKMIEQLDLFRKTFYEHLDELKETPGNHKKWADVDSEEHGRWPWLSLPSDKPVTTK